MSKPIILVTGANGQLAQELQQLSNSFEEMELKALSKDEMPINDMEYLLQYFKLYKPAYCVNAAAYTAVDKAETEKEKAFAVNADGVGMLAGVCKEFGTKLIHISTDYVFDGSSPEPYKEEAPVNPISVYGLSKLKGEALCLYNNPDAIVIRTAWVYSTFGNNFVKTMLRLMKERPEIKVVNDQIGAPTYAADLAEAILTIIKRDVTKEAPLSISETGEILEGNGDKQTRHWFPGIYHYSNQGRISWYEFAEAIKTFTKSACVVHPIPSSEYPTPAKRPSFSLLNTEKIRATYGIMIPDWKDSLEKCLGKLKFAS